MHRLLVLTDRSQLPPGRRLDDQVARCVEAGARWVCVRERDLPAPQRARLVARMTDLLHSVGGDLTVAAPPPDSDSPDAAALGHGADGVHLRAHDAWPRDLRPRLVGRSTHDRAELVRAVGEGSDYVTLSPYALTASKPGYGPALGAGGTHAALEALELGRTRVLALGGVRAADVPEVLAAGAHGVAVMGALMRAPDPAPQVRALLDVLGQDTA